MGWPRVEVGRFQSDEAGNLLLVNGSGFAMARAAAGSLIPTLAYLPEGLASSSIQITPVFITSKGSKM